MRSAVSDNSPPETRFVDNATSPLRFPQNITRDLLSANHSTVSVPRDLLSANDSTVSVLPDRDLENDYLGVADLPPISVAGVRENAVRVRDLCISRYSIYCTCYL